MLVLSSLSWSVASVSPAVVIVIVFCLGQWSVVRNGATDERGGDAMAARWRRDYGAMAARWRLVALRSRPVVCCVSVLTGTRGTEHAANCYVRPRKMNIERFALSTYVHFKKK